MIVLLFTQLVAHGFAPHATRVRSARVGDEIGGHTVSGHVHTTAQIVKVTDTENNRRVEFKVGGRAGGGVRDTWEWWRGLTALLVCAVCSTGLPARCTCGPDPLLCFPARPCSWRTRPG